MAESVGQDDFGWFTPADLRQVILAIHQLEDWKKVILVGGQSLTAWVEYYKIELPVFEGPYLTADADFLGTKAEAKVIASYLRGKAQIPKIDDHTPNTAIIEFTGEEGTKLLIDMLVGVLGVSTEDAAKLAVSVVLYDWQPVQILHPLLVLESRCANLERLPHKRENNGITQARVACLVVAKYLDDCVTTPARRKECLRAAKRIAALAKSSAGVYVWREWGIDVLDTVDPSKMPGQFPRSWEHEIAKVMRKREIALARRKPQCIS
ncbi:hypothetical protein GCM10011487_68920 [Steroidobacter agaridevorans]|uniref:Uncharacterized protein n=1 Tax=Steroidobacter agaridevorans TaxID=2695856 RepID=A0A829YQ49_9GAMM|nr:hypothetical protein [Steroidobacter agaridevorans]GFE84892.1 hypothetical protein GCM10011487_68920 [Steroidobacter agaridevorans]